MNKILALAGVILILVTGAAAIGLIDPGGGGSKASVTASSGSAATKLKSAQVPIKNYMFVPAELHVQLGARVKWVNRDSAAHTATADQGAAFDTGTLNQGQSKKITFDKAGTFTYHCLFHPFMKGTVTVG